MDETIRLRKFLDEKVERYNRPDFIAGDPISVPHRFQKKQDIEIAGFFSAIFSWGNRKTIVKKCNTLMRLMDEAPWDFCVHHAPKDMKRMQGFVHRTFNEDDLFYFIAFLKHHYQKYSSLEDAFFHPGQSDNTLTVEFALNYFYDYFFSTPNAMQRTKKHLAAPKKGSACKRLNMFLRWMARKDNNGVDFGIWKRIKPSQLICPLDVHVARVARRLGLLDRKQNDWKAAMELTERLKTFDNDDPVKYDFALFGLGIQERYE